MARRGRTILLKNQRSIGVTSPDSANRPAVLTSASTGLTRRPRYWHRRQPCRRWSSQIARLGNARRCGRRPACAHWTGTLGSGGVYRSGTVLRTGTGVLPL